MESRFFFVIVIVGVVAGEVVVGYETVLEDIVKQSHTPYSRGEYGPFVS